jgi:hypothetical protein
MRYALAGIVLSALLVPGVAAGDRQQLFGPYFAADANHTSHLLVHNKRGDLPVTAAIYLLFHGQRIPLMQMTLAPKESKSVRIDAARVRTMGGDGRDGGVLIEYDSRVALDAGLARAGVHDVASIRVVSSGSPGDVNVAGALVDAKERYAGRVRFNDLAHGEHSRVLRAQFLLLGPQEPALGFSSDALFTARCAVRNATESAKIIRPRVKWLENGATRTADLPTLRLQPREVRVLGLAAAQARGEIPASFHFGALEISYEGEPGPVIAQLTSVEQKTGLVLDTSMTSHESHAIAGMEWSIDGQDRTLLSVTNAASRSDTLTVQLFSDGRTIDLPPLDLARGAMALLDLRAAAGLLGGAPRGTFEVRGAHGSRSAFRLERLMVTDHGLSAAPGTPAADDGVSYVAVDGDERVLWIRTTTSDPAEPSEFPPPEGTVTLDLSTIARWSSGTATTDETDTTEYVTDAAHLTIRQPPGPQVTVSITIYHPPPIGELISRFHDPCSNNYLLTVPTRIGSPLSAYQITGNFHPICEYRPTCWGTCTTSTYTTIAGTAACTPAGQPFVQCAGLSVNGRCLLHNVVCLPSSSMGVCN